MDGILLPTDDHQIRELDELLRTMRRNLIEANETIETHNLVRKQQLFEQILRAAERVICTIRPRE